MESAKNESTPSSSNSIAMTTRVAQVMKMDPPYCTPDDTIRTAARLMTASGSDYLPVVEPQHNGQLIGAVTASDVAAGAEKIANGPDTPVSEIMLVEPPCCSIGDDIETVRRLMSERGVGAVPVVDDWGCCIGLVVDSEPRREFGSRSPIDRTPKVAPRIKPRRSVSSSSSVPNDHEKLHL